MPNFWSIGCAMIGHEWKDRRSYLECLECGKIKRIAMIDFKLFNDNEMLCLYCFLRDTVENKDATQLVSKELDIRGIDRRA